MYVSSAEPQDMLKVFSLGFHPFDGERGSARKAKDLNPFLLSNVRARS
jgi:hypothetical protein